MTAPKSPIKAVTKVSSMIRNRRGATISASTPSGTVHKNIGRVLATCTSVTALGSGFRLVISQAEDVSEMASPVNEQVVATHITANGVWENAPQRGAAAATRSTERSAAVGRGSATLDVVRSCEMESAASMDISF